MFPVGQRRAGVRNKEHLVIHHHRIPRRGFAADLRQGAGNDQRIDATFLQTGMQIRGTWNESTEATLHEDQILLRHVQLRPERVAGIAGRERFDCARAMFGRPAEMFKKDRPGADRLRIHRVLRIDDNPPAARRAALMRLTLGTIVRAVGTSATWPSPMKPFCKSTTMCAVWRGLNWSNTATPPRRRVTRSRTASRMPTSCMGSLLADEALHLFHVFAISDFTPSCKRQH